MEEVKAEAVQERPYKEGDFCPECCSNFCYCTVNSLKKPLKQVRELLESARRDVELQRQRSKEWEEIANKAESANEKLVKALESIYVLSKSGYCLCTLRESCPECSDTKKIDIRLLAQEALKEYRNES